MKSKLYLLLSKFPFTCSTINKMMDEFFSLCPNKMDYVTHHVLGSRFFIGAHIHSDETDSFEIQNDASVTIFSLLNNSSFAVNKITSIASISVNNLDSEQPTDHCPYVFTFGDNHVIAAPIQSAIPLKNNIVQVLESRSSIQVSMNTLAIRKHVF